MLLAVLFALWQRTGNISSELWCERGRRRHVERRVLLGRSRRRPTERAGHVPRLPGQLLSLCLMYVLTEEGRHGFMLLLFGIFSFPKRRFVSRLTITTRKWVKLVCVDGYPPDCNARRWPLRLSGACRYLSVVDELTGYR